MKSIAWFAHSATTATLATAAMILLEGTKKNSSPCPSLTGSAVLEMYGIMLKGLEPEAHKILEKKSIGA